MKANRNKAVFLDRDGVINKKAPKGDYIKNWEEFKFLPGVKSAIKKLNKEGFLVIIVSNQRGIARCVMTDDDLAEIHSKMIQELEKVGAVINGIYYCPHDINDNCDCRKPEAGLLFKAAKDFGINLRLSWMIGDSKSDIEAGKKAGCKTILVNNSYNDSEINADLKAKNLSEAVDNLIDYGGE